MVSQVLNQDPKPPLKLLVLGGTRFVGRHMVERFLQAGHQVTLLTRGQLESPFAESPMCHHLQADRNEPLIALEGQVFDAVVDVSGYFPHQIQRVLDTVDFQNYLFVSTISVYDPEITANFEEHGSTSEPNWDALEVTNATYGPLKRACELLLLQEIPNRVCILRPHFVVGSHDYTQRFSSWIHRLTQDLTQGSIQGSIQGSARVFPGPLSNALQFVDARDHADFALLALECNLHGIFNLARDPITWGDLVSEIEAHTQNKIEAVILDSAFVETHLSAGTPFPMWIDSSGESAAYLRVPNARAKAVGFEFRPLEETVRHLLEWDAQTSAPTVGLSAEQEIDALECWLAQAETPLESHSESNSESN